MQAVVDGIHGHEGEGVIAYACRRTTYGDRIVCRDVRGVGEVVVLRRGSWLRQT
jgi:hypothetical protein